MIYWFFVREEPVFAKTMLTSMSVLSDILYYSFTILQVLSIDDTYR